MLNNTTDFCKKHILIFNLLINQIKTYYQNNNSEIKNNQKFIFYFLILINENKFNILIIQ